VLINRLELTEQVLYVPIPNLDEARRLRAAGYADVPLDLTHPLINDSIVSLADYNIASHSYYSRKNVTGDPIPGVKPEVLVRKDIAERLARVSEFLNTADFVTRHAGGKVELYVEEGLRSVGLQGMVYDEIYPNFLRSLHPEWSGDEILAERDRRVAKPSPSSPHASGGAVDVKMRREDGSGSVSFGFDHAEKLTLQTDFFEHNPGNDNNRMNRRLAFHVLSAAGLVNNPEEVWHYGRGDKLSSLVSPVTMPGGLTVPAYYAAVAGAPEMN
jgi:D-alanyl-D-alanine dipeptidase